KWKDESGGTILKQLKKLGASCDWTRLRFTMDDGLSKAVREVFTRLYKEGLIYRGDYIINWCPRCHTALSDLEVQFIETDSSLWYLKYPLKDNPSITLTVATTRPETMLGDTAVAINPEDPRYKGFIGKFIKLPLTGREIPVVADESVSMEFGTGAVKITPAHDFNDFELSKRHNLSALKVMDIDANMNENAGVFKGLDRFSARKKVVSDLENAGLLEKADKYKVMLGSCYRCQTVVEPTLSKQWFIKVAPLAEPAIKAVEDGIIRFVPKGWENTYFDWMKNIRDWCISRQIWWGHRIPAWHCKDCGHITVDIVDPDSCSKCNGKNIEQDTDVLDTWFSSALWPFSTLGWPEKTDDLERFYPTSVLSTSFDIIFFWVARMIMMGLKFMDGQPPFKDVYIHALIRDAEGQKMSKSKGNVIDPLIMMDAYGTDAFRFTLAALAAQGRDIKLAEERVEGYRNFCNKLWNLARFILMNVEEGVAGGVELDVQSHGGQSRLSTADKWILTRLAVCDKEVSDSLDKYQFDDAARALYRFVWHEACDWYVELIKPDLKGDNGALRKATATTVLMNIMKDALRLIHPFMPFITEEIYSKLPGDGLSILEGRYPENPVSYPQDAASMELVMEVIRAIRNIRVEMNVAQGAKIEVICFAGTAYARERLLAGSEYVSRLAKAANFSVATGNERPADSASSVVAVEGGVIEVFVPLKGLIDLDSEVKKIGKELDAAVAEHTAVEKKLSNESFTAKAPKEVVAKEEARLKTLLEKKAKLESALERLKGLSA
ncbi:valine--tRNA ligase, partial [bacterium]